MKTDSQLQKDVLAELAWEPSVHAAQIGVEVRDGVVTLAGHVSSYAEKWAAERAAQRVSGVRALAIEMDVKLSALGKRDDADIARSAETALAWLSYLPEHSVKMMVEGGCITLTGDVDWQYQKEAAGDALRYMVGVKAVSNQIGIKPKTSISAVKSDIEAALKRRAPSDAKHIAVDVKGNDVTLTGTVQSWSERELARESAWNTPGVRSVVDNISVAY